MADLTRRDFLKLAAAAAVAPAFLEGCGKAEDPNTLNLFNWSNYIGKTTLADFEKASGVKVRYDMYSDEEEMFSKLKAGVQGYDVIVGTDYMIPRLQTLGLIDPIPHDLLQNLGNVDKQFADPEYDRGLKLTVPYLWGTTGIGYNKEKLGKAPTSWWDVWDPKHKGRISALDNSRDAIGIGLLMLGLARDAKDPALLAKVREHLLKQKPLLKHYTSSTYIDELVSAEVWLAEGWSGDVLQASRDNKQIDYTIPKEGSFMWVDSLCLVKGSTRRAHALRFIDFVLNGANGAHIANTVRYATPNAKAKPLLDKALLADGRVFPPREVAKRLSFYPVLDPQTEELWNRTWQEVKVA